MIPGGASIAAKRSAGTKSRGANSKGAMAAGRDSALISSTARLGLGGVVGATMRRDVTT